MTKKIIRGLAAGVLVMIGMLVYMSIDSSIKALDKVQEDNYKYHFQVIVDKDMDKVSRKELIEGVYSAGKDENVYIEVIESIDSDTKKEIIDRAIYSKVDGIAYNAEVKKVADKLATRAAAVDIPIVNYGLTADNYKSVLSIQDSPQNIARTVGLHMKSIVKEKKVSKKDEILLLLKECDEKDAHINDKIISGFIKGISKKYKDYVKVVRVDAKGYDVNSKIKSQINKNKKAKIVVCFDEEYTDVVSAIYDDEYNIAMKKYEENKQQEEKNSKKKELKEVKDNYIKPERVKVVGYDATQNNTTSVEDGKIALLFNVKNKSIGYNAIKALCGLKKDSSVDKDRFKPLFQVIKLDKDNKLEYIDKVSVDK